MPLSADISRRALTGLFLVVVTLIMFTSVPPAVTCLLLLCMSGYILCVEWPTFDASALTLIYPVIPLASLMALVLLDARQELLWLIMIIAAHDTGAYLSGKLWGVHKICPTISPGKSWEGVIGGYLASLSVACIMNISISTQLTLHGTATLVAVIALLNGAGVAGDLFESWLKRRAHLKDSGAILPGHGGLLDRIDSLLFAVPVWLIVRRFL